MQPTNTALMVNNAMHPKGRIDVVPAFRAIERIYSVTIHATHRDQSVLGHESPRDLLSVWRPGHREARRGSRRG